jgi:hypothetical protein
MGCAGGRAGVSLKLKRDIFISSQARAIMRLRESMSMGQGGQLSCFLPSVTMQNPRRNSGRKLGGKLGRICGHHRLQHFIILDIEELSIRSQRDHNHDGEDAAVPDG